MSQNKAHILPSYPLSPLSPCQIPSTNNEVPAVAVVKLTTQVVDTNTKTL